MSSGFMVPFIEYRQRRFSIILKGPGIFRMVNEYWFQPEVTAALVPHRRVNLSFEAAGVSNLLASLGHSRRKKVVLGHTLNPL